MRAATIGERSTEMKSQRSNPCRVISGLILCVAMVVFSSCSEDGPTAPQSGQIPGTWDLTGISSALGGQTFTIPPEEIAADPVTRMFSDDGTGNETYQGSTTPFDWSTSGSTLTLIGSSGTLVFTYSVSATTMTFEFDEQDGGATYEITHTFTRR